jgi:dephospho-CoA kinase
MVQYFGQEILNTEGEIDRKKLGPLVFSNKVNNKSIKFYYVIQLQSVVHRIT